jgi:hypothetical protein
VAPHPARPLRYRRPAVLAALAALAALLLALAAPVLLWAYHLSAAGALLERTIAWPTPRLVDSLPAAGDPAALTEAERHLDAARRWRPDHPYAYRLAGQAALARRDWTAAARLLDEARARAPRHPLIAWEAGLAYEQLWDAAPGDLTLRDHMLGAWRAAGLDAAALHTRAAEARANGRPTEAPRWERRAALME